ncbi:hypothetical protein ACUXAV_004939 [Cupriavidus metallidurans]|jgi:hypothetical protein|uniref:hypothetical protein n=1 Tax=Cupriavidus TaxID=106589 RepID=UPI0004933656|nr:MULTISPECIES: hypothetical protein [Cupriavidus]AVA38079.1 hypothetical protein C3Z06_31235 [Cupriavidus metallidurans]MCA3185245.1 hypothetical protein [Cupriavidus sp.]MCA3188611.1 hypothetical protein [Cupriavidus sp.]MCA3232401.1 hypothetical protein [Cupriavidus sp.]MDE4922676.1 hypothetical protein [Cupriavidus metallidurans]
MDIPLEVGKAIYRTAIDRKAHDAEGVAWWAGVVAEVAAVIRADNVSAAAQVILWWHADWTEVGDTARAAASRIRRAARNLKVRLVTQE